MSTVLSRSGDLSRSPGLVGGEHPAGPRRLRGLEEGNGPRHQEDGAGHQGEGVRRGQDEPDAEGAGRVDRRTFPSRCRQDRGPEDPAHVHPQDHRVATPEGFAGSGKGDFL